MSSIPEQVTGRGLVFPITLENGSVKPQSGLPLIESCIKNILAFDLGSRYFQRDFGVALEPLLSEPNDKVTEQLLDYRLRTQLPMWDKRITVNSINITRSNLDSSILIHVNISLTGVDQTKDIIFPINNTI